MGEMTLSGRASFLWKHPFQGSVICPSASPPPQPHPNKNLICSTYVHFPLAGAELWNPQGCCANIWAHPPSPTSSKPRTPAAGREKATQAHARTRGCLPRTAAAQPPPQSVKGQAQFSLRKETCKLLFPNPGEFQRKIAMETAVTNTLSYK